jgi:iron complex outermembrane receptor protein
MKHALSFSALFVLTALAAAPPGRAQPEAEQPRPAAVQPAGALEQILVSARKREEDLQDVSTSVSALGPTELDRRFDLDLRDFANAAPNVIIDDLQQGPGSPAAISIRGIGTSDVEKSFDPTVGVVVDGVFIGVNSGAMLKALDLETVEILRGPQGTLFGRNSIAGVINVTRSRPAFEFGGRIRAGYGNYDDIQLDGYVNIPIVADRLAIKLGGAKREQDGYFYHIDKDVDVGKQDYRALNASVLLVPLDGLEIYYRFDRQWQDQDANTVVNMAQPGQLWCNLREAGFPFENHCAVSLTVPESGGRYLVTQDGAPAESYFDSDTHTLNMGWQFSDGFRMDYVFGKFKTDEAVFQDWDGTSDTLYHTNRPARYVQDSHELRLTSTLDGPLNFVVGAYLWDSKYRIDLQSFVSFVDLTAFGIPLGTVLDIRQSVEQSTKSKALFFEADYKLTDALTLNVGGRYTRDRKTQGVAGGLADDPTFDNLDDPIRDKWERFTPKASISWRFSDEAMVYGLYSAGFRAGGFIGRPSTVYAAVTPYDPEKVDNFELGWKTEWFDNRLRVNGSVYYMKYKDKQEEFSVSVPGGTGQQSLVLNTSSAVIKGLEIDALAIPVEGLTLRATLGLMDAKYKKFILSSPEFDDADFSDRKLRRAPDYTATLGFTYEWPMFGGTAWVSADWHLIAPYELTFDNSPQSRVRSQNIVDASINWQWKGTTFSLWGRNLTKEDQWSQCYDVGTGYTRSGQPVGGLWTYCAPRPPRTYGIRVVQDF